MTSLSPSTPKQPWPDNAVPESWVDSLFTKMSTTYGSRFADMWQGIPIDDVRRAWGIDMRKLSAEQLRAGVHTLDLAFPIPPTWPQFMAHCRQARRSQAPGQLTDNRRADPARYAANMERVRDAAKPRAPSGVAWAHALLSRGKSRSGGALPPEVIRVAQGAIENYKRRTGGDHD